MITAIHQSKTLTKHISCEYKCKLDGRACNSNQKWNNDKSWCECKKHNICEKDYIWNPAIWSYENDKYLANIMYDSVITCDKIIDAGAKSYDEETKTIPNFNEKKVAWKTQNFYILLAFSLITIALLIVVSSYCYLIKYRAKENNLLTFHIINNKLKEVIY